MGVYIKGIKMPECCAMCPLCHRSLDENETRLACFGVKKWCDNNINRMEALEKQDVKIIPIRNCDEFGTCPNCGHDLLYHGEGFCEWCGQKYKMVNEGERKMTNRGWIDLLSKEFSVSRAIARDMFYAIFKRLLTHYQIKRMNRRMSDGRT